MLTHLSILDFCLFNYLRGRDQEETGEYQLIYLYETIEKVWYYSTEAQGEIALLQSLNVVC